jgi:NAD(P)-dependent dehydrogenase (short-subunit alcohol dehydrogenase family)
MKQDRVVVVTGAAGGIGSVLVDRFLANGDTVIAAGRNQSTLDRLLSEHNAGARLIAAVCDISKEEDCGRLASLVRGRTGRVDVLVNNAGFFPVTAFEDLSTEEWRHVIDINLTGVFLMTKAMLPLMKGRSWGRIINIGSGSVYEGVPVQTHYVSAKAGVIGLTKCLARELGGYGITVNIVTPGLTMTAPVLKNIPVEIIATQIETRAIKRDEQPEDLVGAVFFLASPDSDFISGQNLNVDGGKYMPS